jgi:prepilin-type N-terminal cleavage/methylation domain-containing protein
MARPPSRARGYTMLELMVVLIIVGILAIGAVSVIGNKRSGNVRTLLDEVEGTLVGAQQGTGVGLLNVILLADGTWTSPSNRLYLDGRPFDPKYSTTDFTVTANIWDPTKRIGSLADRFISRYTLNAREHMYAGIITTDSEQTTALGGRTWLAGDAFVAGLPASLKTPLTDALASANRLFKGAQNTVEINAQTRRFTTGFHVCIVGIAGGLPYPKGTMGVLVVPANSATIYKFYLREGESTWRRQ